MHQKLIAPRALDEAPAAILSFGVWCMEAQAHFRSETEDLLLEWKPFDVVNSSSSVVNKVLTTAIARKSIDRYLQALTTLPHVI